MQVPVNTRTIGGRGGGGGLAVPVGQHNSEAFFFLQRLPPPPNLSILGLVHTFMILIPRLQHLAAICMFEWPVTNVKATDRILLWFHLFTWMVVLK